MTGQQKLSGTLFNLNASISYLVESGTSIGIVLVFEANIAGSIFFVLVVV